MGTKNNPGAFDSWVRRHEVGALACTLTPSGELRVRSPAGVERVYVPEGPWTFRLNPKGEAS